MIECCGYFIQTGDENIGLCGYWNLDPSVRLIHSNINGRKRVIDVVMVRDIPSGSNAEDIFVVSNTLGNEVAVYPACRNPKGPCNHLTRSWI